MTAPEVTAQTSRGDLGAVRLPAGRIAELERSQTGGEPVGINADDPVAILTLIREHAPGWIENLEAEIVGYERLADTLRERLGKIKKLHGAAQ